MTAALRRLTQFYSSSVVIFGLSLCCLVGYIGGRVAGDVALAAFVLPLMIAKIVLWVLP